MKFELIIITAFIFGLVSSANAGYQSDYNPYEEYNCNYSMGSEKFSYTQNGIRDLLVKIFWI